MVRHPFLVWSSAPIHEGNFTNPGENTYAICVKPAQKIRADQDLVESVPKIIQGFCLVVVIGARRVVVPVTNVHGWRGGWSPAARFLVPIAPFLALAVPVLVTERNSCRVVAAVVFLQLLLDAFFWGHPMLLWSEGPGPAPFLEVLIGRSRAAIVPAWESLNGSVVLASLVGLGIWTGLTWVLVSAVSRPSRPPTA